MALNNSGVVFKTAKACAQLNGLDFMSASSIYIKGNFKELKDDQKVILELFGGWDYKGKLLGASYFL